MATSLSRRPVLIFAGSATLIAICFAFLPPVTQDPRYHAFADARTFYQIPNFWNVVSNIPFLIAALYGLKALPSRTAFIEAWERLAYIILVIGTAAVALGSAYYHFHPDNQTLFWDRLPMTIVFTSLIASTIGERLSPNAGKQSLLPLLLLGIASVLWWRFTGDLRLYGLVQFGAMLVLAILVVRYPPKYTHDRGIWLTGIFYVLAKILEFYDQQIATVIPTGGHPWKHLAAAFAIFFYINSVVLRKPVPLSSPQPSLAPDSIPVS